MSNPHPISHCPHCNVGLRFDRSRTDNIVCPKCKYSGPVESYPLEGSCPVCSKKLLIPNPFSPSVKCPQCFYESAATTFLGHLTKANTDTQKTTLTGSPIDGETQGPGGDWTLMLPGMLTLIDDAGGKWTGDRNPIRLTLGMKTFGRKASTSRADVQLPTVDTSVSRMHFSIEMVKMPSGVLKHRLSDAGSTNGTFCNDQRVNPGDVIILSPGDIIRAGHTILKFDIITA